jgi:hypothetical protein
MNAFELLVDFRIGLRIKSLIWLTSVVIRVLLLFFELQPLQGKPLNIFQTSVTVTTGLAVTDRALERSRVQGSGSVYILGGRKHGSSRGERRGRIIT